MAKRPSPAPDAPSEDDDVSKLRTPPPRQPRSPIPPAHLRRVDHPIDVPAAQRACPKCGADRQCVEPRVTEVIELLPPEVIVCRDIREQLTCATCGGEPARRSRACPASSPTPSTSRVAGSCAGDESACCARRRLRPSRRGHLVAGGRRCLGARRAPVRSHRDRELAAR
jgi:hypothetical protein